MAWTINGIFQRSHNWQQDKDNNIKIQASRMDAEFNGIVGAINDIKDGTKPVTLGALSVTTASLSATVETRFTTIEAGVKPTNGWTYSTLDTALQGRVKPSSGWAYGDLSSAVKLRVLPAPASANADQGKVSVVQSGGGYALDTKAASETSAGFLELATTTEATTGTDTSRAVTPAGLASYVASYIPHSKTSSTQIVNGVQICRFSVAARGSFTFPTAFKTGSTPIVTMTPQWTGTTNDSYSNTPYLGVISNTGGTINHGFSSSYITSYQIIAIGEAA
ncbi:MAG: hypothetical protein HRT36_05495 [Alphaproteobacteria bacterium]|nr:hypothetical protein [Alphaproteobacteria bacterium]